jgi:DNA (cytosine-5)-methyltransferase 1
VAVHNCQGFSHGGKKKMDDPRNELVHQFVRAARLIRPRYIIGENVPGLLSRKGKDPTTGEIRPVIDIIRDLFAGIGYHITYRVLKATDAGVPQERKRLIIVGTKAEKGFPHMAWDDSVELTSEKHTGIRPFLESHLEGAVECPAACHPQEVSPHYWIETDAVEPTGKPHPNLLRLAGGIRNRSTKEKEKDGDTSSLVIEGGLISFGVRKSSYHGQILDPDMPSKTIICTYGTCPRLFVGLHNKTTGKYWVRCLSTKELGQIQGFPADYPWQGNEKDIITQIGNAVPPPLCERVVRLLPKIEYKDVPQYSIQPNTEESSDEEDEEL